MTTIIIENLTTLGKYPDCYFDADASGKLQLSYQMTDVALHVIRKTFENAERLENTPDAIKIRIDDRLCSLGHIWNRLFTCYPLIPVSALEDIVPLPFYPSSTLEDVTEQAYDISVGGRSFTLTYEQLPQILQTMLEDTIGPSGILELPYSRSIDTSLFDVAVIFIQTGKWPEHLTTDDLVDLLNFANFCDWPKLFTQINADLINRPLRALHFERLSLEDLLAWSAASNKRLVVALIKELGEAGHWFTAMLINKQILHPADFSDIEEFMKYITPKDIKHLNLRHLNPCSPEMLQMIVSTFPHVTHLAFPKQITDHHLTSITSLLQLESLHLQECETLTDAALDEISKLINLKHLDITGCPFTSSALLELRALSSLVSLHLAETAITDATLTHLVSHLPDLTDINIDQCNSLSDNGIRCLKTLKKLKTLSLSFAENIISDDTLTHIGEIDTLEDLRIMHTDSIFGGIQDLLPLQNLKSIDLENCYLFDESLIALSELKNLKTLRFSVHFGELPESATPVDFFPPEIVGTLKQLKQLTHLRLGCDPEFFHVPDHGLHPLTSLENLTHLELVGFDLTSKMLKELSILRNLTTLKLYNCHLNVVGFAHLTSLENITYLRLHACGSVNHAVLRQLRFFKQLMHLSIVGRVTKEELSHFCHIRLLRTLTLYSEHVTLDDLRLLQTHLPYCEINFRNASSLLWNQF